MSDDSAKIIVTCPACEHRMKAPRELVGKSTSCLKCGERFPVHDSPDGKPGSKSDAANPANPAAARSGIVKLLLDAKLVTEPQVQEALALEQESGVRIYEALILLGHLRKDVFDDMLMKQPGVASIDLKNYRVQDDLIAMLPEDFVTERLVLPIDQLGKLLTLAMACPLDTDTIQEVQEMTGLRVNPVLSQLDDIQAAISRYYGRDAEKEEDFSWMGRLTTSATTDQGDASPAVVAEEKISTPSIIAVQPAAEASPEYEKFAAHVAEIEGLPACPQVLKRIVSVSDDPMYPIRDLALICTSDPVLTARLIGTANAAAYGMPGRVDNANLAVTLLGVAGTLRVVEACEAITPFRNDLFDSEAFFSRSRFGAAAAQGLARFCPRVSTAAALSAGLLHKIGLPVMAQIHPEALSDGGDAERIAQERLMIGVGHPEAGALLAQKWRLPNALVTAIRVHAESEQASKTGELASITAIAARMAESHARGSGKAALDTCVPLLDALHLDASIASQVFDEVSGLFSA